MPRALKAANQFEDIADRLIDNGESFNAAVGRTSGAIFLGCAMIIGKICYGPANDHGTLDETVIHAVQQMRRCVKATMNTDFWSPVSNMLYIFQGTEAGEEFRRRSDNICLHTDEVADVTWAKFKENLKENLHTEPGIDEDGDSKVGEEDDEEELMFRKLCDATRAEVLSEVKDDIITRYGFVIPKSQKRQKGSKSGKSGAQKQSTCKDAGAKSSKSVSRPEERSRTGIVL